MPLVSWVIPVHWAVKDDEPIEAQWLVEAIHSCFDQKDVDPDFEVVVVNDCNGDGPWWQSLLSWSNADPRLILCGDVTGTNPHGAGWACNRGILLSSGKFVARLDADDVALSDRLSYQLEIMRGDVDVHGGGASFISESGQFIKSFVPPWTGRRTGEEMVEILRRGDNPLVHPSVIMRREVADLLYPESFPYSEDCAMWCKLAAMGKIFECDEKPLVRKRQHVHRASAEHRTEQMMSAERARCRFLPARRLPTR